jgi:hypothetical protein
MKSSKADSLEMSSIPNGAAQNIKDLKMDKIQIGVLADNFAHSQLAFYSIVRANELLKSRNDLEFTGFYLNLSPVAVQPNFAVMPIVECFSFKGITVATCLNTARYLLNMPGPSRRIFYLNDLEWLRFNPRAPWEAIAPIYQNPLLELFVRSESHQKIVASSFNRTPKVCEDFRYEQLLG